MSFFRATIFALVLALSVFSGMKAEATAASATTSTPIQLATYGSLPVIVLNLTNSQINFDISTTNPTYYINSNGWGLPIVAGLSGVYYPKSDGTTTTVTNPYNQGLSGGANLASLEPVSGVTSAASQLNFMNMFTLFPSWTGAATINKVQYVALANLTNQGAAATSYNVVDGYPDGNGADVWKKSSDYTSAMGLNAAASTTCSINMDLVNNNVKQATYNININSLGKGSPNIPKAQTTSITSILDSILTGAGNVITILSGADAFDIIEMGVGALSSIQGIYEQSQIDPAVNVPAYNAASKGITVSATATFHDGGNETFSLTQQDNDSLTYQVVPPANTDQNFSLANQNSVLITTWRQCAQNTSVTTERNAADLLIVAVINEAYYSSLQLTQHLTQTVAPSQQKPAKEQVQSTKEVLGILTAIAKQHPQEAQYIVEIFGVHGKYKEIKKDPGALKIIDTRLKEILKPYKNEAMVIEQYLTKL